VKENSNINNRELDERNQFIKEIGNVIKDRRNKIQSDHARSIIDKHKKKELENPPTHGNNGSISINIHDHDNESPGDRLGRLQNDDFINDRLQTHEKGTKDQDVIMDDMISVLKRLDVYGNLINKEIQDQEELLNEVEEEMNTTQDTLSRLTNRLDTLLQHSENKKFLLIAVLVIILVVMVYFMF